VKRVPVGTVVETRWGRAVVTHDYWPNDPNYEITYTEGRYEGTTGSFTGVLPATPQNADERNADVP
jgi:hypothetical protein